jgi:hypothetical protein
MYKLICGCVLAAAVSVGCDTTDESYTEPLGGAMSIELKPANHTIAAGDTVTIATHTRNLAVRGSDIQWASTGGRIELSEDHRIARVRFDNPGRYTVTARALYNGSIVDTSSVQIEVRPVEPLTPRMHTVPTGEQATIEVYTEPNPVYTNPNPDSFD